MTLQLNVTLLVSAVNEGFQYGSQFKVTTLDVSMACISTNHVPATVYPAPLTSFGANDERADGVAFNLYNNVWDTNFIFWYPYVREDKDSKARFKLQFLHDDDDVRHARQRH